MTRITINEQLIAELERASGPIEFCDPTGRRVACFVPMYDSTEVECPLSDEELDRRRSRLGQGKSTSQLLRDLGIKS